MTTRPGQQNQMSMSRIFFDTNLVNESVLKRKGIKYDFVSLNSNARKYDPRKSYLVCL